MRRASDLLLLLDMGFGELEASDALGRDQSIELTVEALLHQRATRALSRYAQAA
jgi:hypothetical protein